MKFTKETWKRIGITVVEAVSGYLVIDVIPTLSWETLTSKEALICTLQTVGVGIVGAIISAIYNLCRERNDENGSNE